MKRKDFTPGIYTRDIEKYHLEPITYRTRGELLKHLYDVLKYNDAVAYIYGIKLCCYYSLREKRYFLGVNHYGSWAVAFSKKELAATIRENVPPSEKSVYYKFYDDID